MEKSRARIFIGTGGWEHDIFDRCLYPSASLSSLAKLGHYACFFNTVEVRPTFWDDTLDADDAAEWAGAVHERSDFLFSVKLHSSLTHRRDLASASVSRMTALLEALHSRQRLGAVLAQFPFSFTATGANRFYIEKLATLFRDFPLHVELRHASWDQPSLSRTLEELSVAPVQADLPRMRQLMNSLPRSRGERAYLRLHGRSEKGWLSESYDARYDYLYNIRELHEIKRRIQALPATCTQVFALCNNTTGGKAVANALQLAALLNERGTVRIPEATLRAFPFLQQIAREQDPGAPLFGEYRAAM